MSDNPQFAVNSELLQEFLQESTEMLDSLDQLFVSLERKPDDLGIINEIFRPVHSIKGNSAFFNLHNLKNFSHILENLLQEIRNGKRHPTAEIISALLRGIDLLRQMLARLSAGEMSTTLTDEEQTHLDKLTNVSQSAEATVESLAQQVRVALAGITQVPTDLAEKFHQLKSGCESLLNIVAPEAKTAVARADEKYIYKINGNEITDQVHIIITMINDMAEKSKDATNMEVFAAALKELLAITANLPVNKVLTQLEDEFTTINNSGIGFDDLFISLMKEHLDESLKHIEVIGVANVEATSEPKPAEVAPAATKPAAPVEAAKKPAPAEAAAPAPAEAKAQKTLRVNEETIDTFINYVSELIITGEVFHYLQKHLEQNSDRARIIKEFKSANTTFNSLSLNLQKSIMAIRMVPIKQILQKLPRIVRDTSTALGKKIEFTVIGEDIQIDKSLVENLEAPLIHMVRNSVDHGISTPEDRVSMGKPETGQISLSAAIVEDKCILKLKDDGRGINVEAVKKKSVESGAITEERARTMSDAEACRLIFGAGVSTAKTVTEVSGRGVGMDVVLSSITALRGVVDINSVTGKGTEVTITLPMSLTTLVIDGVLVRVGNDQYIIPLVDIRNLIRPQMDQFTQINENQEMILVRDELYRIMRLDEFFVRHNISSDQYVSEHSDLAKSTIVLVENEGRTCALVVDEILGQQSVVLKDLNLGIGNADDLKFIRGTAILGDGRVGLVINVKNLIGL